MDKPEQPIDYNRPVAYDAEGRPLYAHPPIETPKVAKPKKRRSTDIIDKSITDAVKLKHERSQRVFPELDLNEGDYVISSVRRHPIGLVPAFTLGIVLITLSFTALFNYDLVVRLFQLTGSMADSSVAFWPITIFVIFVMLGEYVAYYVFSSNKFFVTNESVVHQIQTGLFSSGEQIVSLGNVEDASYTQNGIIQQLFNYGSIRVSTRGEDTIYRFTYVSDPKECVATLEGAIEHFKDCNKPC
ncbi:MAG: PH domain-containing protein [Candidatus Saccharibacteria bacterium]